MTKARLWAAGVATLLFALNAYVCRELFRIEYLNQPGSIESAYISIARYARDYWNDLSWFPLWYGGIPYQNTYPPLLHFIVAAISGLTGWSPAHSYHFAIAVFYCLGPVVVFLLCYRLSSNRWYAAFAGLAFSVLSPSAFLMTEVRHDVGGVFHPRRFQTLVSYGEGPHVAALVFLAASILLLDLAIRNRKPLYYGLAAVACAATALTNWLAAFGLAAGVFAYLVTQLRSGEDRRSMRWMIASMAGIAVLAYCLAAPWIPPSTVSAVQANSRVVAGDFTGYASSLPVRAGIILLLVCLVKLVAVRFDLSRTLQFAAIFSIVVGALALAWSWWGIAIIPQPHRYHTEMDMGLAILLPFALEPVVSLLKRRWQYVIAGVAVAGGLVMAKQCRHYAWKLLQPVDITQRVEYKLGRWLAEHMPNDRVMVPGTVAFYLNAFTDTPQLGGGFDQGRTNPLNAHAIYVIYTSDGAGDRDAEISETWLKALGVRAIATGGPNSGEYYKPFAKPKKFEGKLEELWRDGDDVLYRVPARSPSLAHVVRASDLPARAPVNGIDIDPIRPYVTALEDGSLPLAEFRWTTRHSADIRARLTAEQLVSVQISYHAGWRAAVGGHTVRTFEDHLGQLAVEPRCSGECSIQLIYDGGAEMKIAKILHWLGVLAVIACIVAGFIVKRRTRGSESS